MYYCEACKKLVGPREPQNTVVMEKRRKEYVYPVNLEGGSFQRVSVGWEIVREAKVCGDCVPTMRT